MKQQNNQRAIISVIGPDEIGIVAKVTTLLAEYHVNVIDISQTIMDGIFTMMMLADLESATISFAEISSRLKTLGSKIGQEISIYDEQIIRVMHRI